MRNYAALVFLALSPVIAQAKLYKWVDEKGNVHYSDIMPDSKSAANGTSELNKRAIIVKQAESAEQRAAKAELERQTKLSESARLEQARRDKALVDTFANGAEVDALRDRHLEQVQAGINTDRARKESAQKRLTKLKEQRKSYQNRQQKVPQDLVSEISGVELEILQIDKDMQNKAAERDTIIKKAEEDKKRLRQLQTGQ